MLFRGKKQNIVKKITSIIVNSAQSIVSSDIFDWIVTGVILLQALVLAIEATPALLTVHRDDELLRAETLSFNWQICSHHRFHRQSCFETSFQLTQNLTGILETLGIVADFAIIILSLMPIAGQFSTIARLVRLLRITRLVTKSRELRAIVDFSGQLDTQYI